MRCQFMAGSPRYFISFPWQFVSEPIYDHLYSKLKRSASGVQWLSLEPGLLGLESNVLTAKSMRLHKQSFFFSFFFQHFSSYCKGVGAQKTSILELKYAQEGT